MIDFDMDLLNEKMSAMSRIKVLGIGGGGGNMINNMIELGFDNITFIAVNTDAQALKVSKAPHKIQIGVKSTKGLGAGANPEAGKKAAEEDLDVIINAVKDADIAFLTAGLGGGTGSGAMPVIAKALKEKDILTVAIVTKPFAFEGKKRMKIAQEALELLRKEVDTIIVLQNQKLIDTMKQDSSLVEAFARTNNVLNQFIVAISDIIHKHGHINVDFADVKTIMSHKGFALIGIGRANGPDRALKAATDAISSPLLENVDISNAKGLLFNIAGSEDLGIHELNQAASLVYKKAHEDANIVIGSVIDNSLEQDVLVTVIATGFSDNEIIKTSEAPYNQLELDNQSLNNKNTATKIDLNDLDIPAVMRKVMRENQL